LSSEDASSHGVLWLISEGSLSLLIWLHEGIVRLLLRLPKGSLSLRPKESSGGRLLWLCSGSKESPCRFVASEESSLGGLLRLRAEAIEIVVAEHMILYYYGRRHISTNQLYKFSFNFDHF
jgi:hypothetical protein